MLLIKNQSTVLISSDQSSPHTVLARLFSGLSACFCSTANSWLFVTPCLNLQLQPASPPFLGASPSFPGASILLNQSCAPLQRAPVTSSLQFRCGAKTHQLKLAASDLPGVSFCQDEKAESRQALSHAGTTASPRDAELPGRLFAPDLCLQGRWFLLIKGKKKIYVQKKYAFSQTSAKIFWTLGNTSPTIKV